jgi:hypothetical protein
MTEAPDVVELAEPNTMWGVASIGPDRSIGQFVLAGSEAEALDLIARIFVRLPGGLKHFTWGLGRIQFAVHAPIWREPGPRPESPPLEPWQTNLGIGPTIWGAIHLDSLGGLKDFIAAHSADEARATADAAMTNPGGYWWGVARIEIKMSPLGLNPAEPLPNPFRTILRDHPERVAPDLLPVVKSLMPKFDVMAESASQPPSGGRSPLQRYLQEDGSGSYRRYRVPDLVPQAGAATELLIVLESPHIDELRTGVPASGGTGRAALKFLSPTGTRIEALGHLVASRQAEGDFRIAILNVSPVPLQNSAFAKHEAPHDLTIDDWRVIAEIQRSQASDIADLKSTRAQSVSQFFIQRLQSRISSLDLSSAMIVIAGTFVQRTWPLILTPRAQSTLRIPHPSNGWWTRTERPEYIRNLAELKIRFAQNS